MIYVEKICDNKDDFAIVRQKNKKDSAWYGISLLYRGEQIADNENWIADDLIYLLKKHPKEALKELHVFYIKRDTAKILLKLLKKAKKLGWFLDPTKL